MTLAPNALYLHDPEFLVSLFALREPGTAEMLNQERALWPRYTEVEILNEVHAALMPRPEWVLEVVA